MSLRQRGYTAVIYSLSLSQDCQIVQLQRGWSNSDKGWSSNTFIVYMIVTMLTSTAAIT